MRRLIVFLAALALPFAFVAAASATGDLTPYQWGLPQIHAQSAWQVSTGAGITVGVVDTGADAGHPDFGGRVSTVDCSGGGGCHAGGDDRNGHGTHVTGIIAAARDGSGTTGVAPDTHVIVAKVFVCDSSPGCDNPSADLNDVQTGVNYLLAQGVVAINMSLGDPGLFGSGLSCNDSAMKSMVESVWSGGAVPVLAAGNCGGGILGGQALTNAHALIVAATGPHDESADYNNSMSGVTWGLAAPGGNPHDSCPTDSTRICCHQSGDDCVLSTWPRSKSAGQDPYYLEAGTSMAAPAVTGAVAALRAHGLDRDGSVNAIMSSLDHISCGSGCQGRLNLQRALGAPDTTTVTTAPHTTPSFGAQSTHRTATTRKATTPRVTAAPTTAAPAPETTATEAPTITTEPPPATRQAALKPRSGRASDDSAAPVVVLLALLGVAAAGAGVATAWRRRARAGAEL